MFLSKYWAVRASAMHTTKCSIERHQSWLNYFDSGFDPKFHDAYSTAHARHTEAVEAHILLLKG